MDRNLTIVGELRLKFEMVVGKRVAEAYFPSFQIVCGSGGRGELARKRVYFSSVMMARCWPRTSVSACVRLRVLNLTVPEV